MKIFLAIKDKINNNPNIWRGLLASLVLWFCVWATYNTDIFRIFSPGFPHSLFDLVHGIRSIFPFVALAVAIIILIKNRKLNRNLLKGPMGLLLAYSIIGTIACLLSKDPLAAFYWGVLYLSVIIILFSVITGLDSIKKISLLIKINWVIAGAISVGLLAFFFIQPGAVSSLTYNFLICTQRPFESLADMGAGMDVFGMVGTRPTGLGRYAGLVAIITLVSFFYSKKRSKVAWFSSFVIFLSILLFSKGKTEILAFIVAMIFVIWLAKKINIFSILGLSLISMLSVFTIFYNIPCDNSLNSITSFVSYISPSHSPTSNNLNAGELAPAPVSAPPPQLGSTSEPKKTNAKDLKNIVTLSGRTTGVWQDAWHLFLSSPLVGYGFQADRFFLNGQHAHNSIIHALIQTGILGTIPFLLAFILMFLYLARLFKNPHIELQEKNFLVMLSAVLVFFAVRSITESVAFFSADWLFVAPIIAYIQLLDGQLKKRNNNLRMDFLGNKIDLLGTSDVVGKIKYWIKNESQRVHWIIVTGMHGIVEAEKHASFKFAISHANVWVPDGISLVWLARLKGLNIKNRVSGADLMQEFFKVAEKEGFSSYFYGDTEDTLKLLKDKLLGNFPNLKIAGSYSPPFRELLEKEDDEIIEKINQAKPDVLFVALGLPKQEKWIFKHREKLNVPVVIGVGAALKFISGKVKRAPVWVGSAGLEWLWRLVFETKTVWRRVFVDLPFFVWLVLKSFFNTDFQQKIVKSGRLMAGKILLLIERNFLFPIGAFIGPKLLEQLTPYDASGFEEKIRLGNLSDGGYVIPSRMLPLVEVLYCYGVADHIDFEEDFIKHKSIPIRFYDHTVSSLPSKNSNFFFKKQGIAEREYGNFNTFQNHVKDNGDRGKKILLKIDVEGAEWKILEKIIDESSENVVAIILEIHKLYKYSKIMSYIRVLKKINSKFILVHLHGNNYCKSFMLGNNKISDCLELTLINNNLVNSKSIMSHGLPSEKDYPNVPGREDLPLDFWKRR